jgi:anaerobic selenocysteine-containing dehydrogenase
MEKINGRQPQKVFKICAGGMAGTTAAALGFAPKMALAQARNYKLLRAKEIRNTCTYCSVGCGLLMYSLGDGAKNAKEAIYHIEGDPDHPVSRGAYARKGRGCWIMFTATTVCAIRNTARRALTNGSASPGTTPLPVSPD